MSFLCVWVCWCAQNPIVEQLPTPKDKEKTIPLSQEATEEFIRAAGFQGLQKVKLEVSIETPKGGRKVIAEAQVSKLEARLHRLSI